MSQVPVWCEPLGRAVVLHVRIPASYDGVSRFPVLYMFDGHNLFSDACATYGTSWGLDDFLSSYDKDLIVVGLECDHRGNNRLDEYCPFRVESSPIGSLAGKGPVLLDWMVSVLKPAVDAHFLTYPFREATAVAGSSMGGLLAYYALVAYNSVFSKAACLSPAFFVCRDQLLGLSGSVDADSHLYVSRGLLEPSLCSFEPFLERFERAGAKSLFVEWPDHGHNEASWSLESRTWLDFLWKA